ncbi:hypothetical protein N24_0063 [Corynebacterium suranareeae]|uniref:Uncharacterized protein n=1 Tax=Corynebacterium suranareeae TaxID=2506452 RepID=A0A160PMB3_9CORY|nr:hypothetical protein N24_0063 [Corynebacterium suranareeae]
MNATDTKAFRFLGSICGLSATSYVQAVENNTNNDQEKHQ